MKLPLARVSLRTNAEAVLGAPQRRKVTPPFPFGLKKNLGSFLKEVRKLQTLPKSG
jgi:hypothetical protein